MQATVNLSSIPQAPLHTTLPPERKMNGDRAAGLRLALTGQRWPGAGGDAGPGASGPRARLTGPLAFRAGSEEKLRD